MVQVANETSVVGRDDFLNIANPIGQIWSGAMMLEHLGETEAAGAIVRAVERVLTEPAHRTRDLKGHADTAA